MGKNKLIATFNSDLSVLAFIYLNEGKIDVDYLNSSEKPRLNDFVLSIEGKKLEAPLAGRDRSGNHQIGYVEVEKYDQKYYDALVFTLEQNGFKSAVISESVKELLILLSKPIVPLEQRKAVLGDIINMSDDRAAEMVERLKRISGIIKEIEADQK